MTFIFEIIAFYIILTVLCGVVGIYVARLIKKASEWIGVIVGTIVGIVLSVLLWIYYGQKIATY